MKHILLVEVRLPFGQDNGWKQTYSGGYSIDSYDKCIAEAMRLDDSISWMIVAEKRAHSGTEIVQYDASNLSQANTKPSDFRAFQKPIEDYRNNPDYESRNNPDDYIKELHNDRITDWDLYPDSEAMSYPSSKWPREIFIND